MTGDGVNDILALEAVGLLYISVASGSAAARNVVQRLFWQIMTLAHMPEVAAEWQAPSITFQRSAALILVKTACALALYCIIAPPYPFILFRCRCCLQTVGLPSFVLALEPNHDRVAGTPVAFCVSHFQLLLRLSSRLRSYDCRSHLFKLNLSQVSTMALYHHRNSWFCIAGEESLCRLPLLYCAFCRAHCAIAVGGCMVASYCTAHSHVSCHTWHFVCDFAIIFNRISER